MKSSKPRKPETKNKPPAKTGAAKQFVILAAIVVGIVLLGLIANQKRQRPASEVISPKSESVPSSPTNETAAVNQTQPNFEKLKGKWLRPDGGYVIEIKSVDSSGKLDAGYFNPRPIHVAKAEAKQEGSAMKVFIELQDVNYPGSTYTLTYVPDRDLLIGMYFQALQRQDFEVYFERVK